MPLPEHLKFLHREPEELTRQYHDRLNTYHNQLNGEGVPELAEPVRKSRDEKVSLNRELATAQVELADLERDNAKYLILDPQRAHHTEIPIIKAAKEEQRKLKEKIAELQSQLEAIEPTTNLHKAHTEIRRLAGDLVTPKDLNDPQFRERADKIWQQVLREQQERRVVEECQEAGENEANKLITFLNNNPKPRVADLKPYTLISFDYEEGKPQSAIPNCFYSSNSRFLTAFLQGYKDKLQENEGKIPNKIGNKPFQVRLELKRNGQEPRTNTIWPAQEAENNVTVETDSPELTVLDLTPNERVVYEQAVERKIAPALFNRTLAECEVDKDFAQSLRSEAEAENKAFETALNLKKQHKIADVEAKIKKLSVELTDLQKQKDSLGSYIEACREYNERVRQYNENESSLTTAEAELKNLNTQLTAEQAKTKKIWLGLRTVSDANPQVVNRLQGEFKVKEGYVKSLKDNKERLQKLLVEAGQKVNAVYNEQGRNVPLSPPFSDINLHELQKEKDRLSEEYDAKYQENNKLGRVKLCWNMGRGEGLDLEEAKFLFNDLSLVMEQLRKRFEELVDQYQNVELVNLIHCVLTLTPHGIKIQMGPAHETQGSFLEANREQDLFPAHEYRTSTADINQKYLPLLKKVAESEKLQVAMARDIGSIYRNRIVKHKQALRIDIVDNAPNS